MLTSCCCSHVVDSDVARKWFFIKCILFIVFLSGPLFNCNFLKMIIRDQWDENPLMNAVRSKNLNCIRALKEAGAMIGCNRIDLGE